MYATDISTAGCGHLVLVGARRLPATGIEPPRPCPRCRMATKARAQLTSARMTLQEHGIDMPDLIGDRAELAEMHRQKEVAALVERYTQPGRFDWDGQMDAYRSLTLDIVTAKREAQWWLDAAGISGICPLLRPATFYSLMGSALEVLDVPPIEDVEERIYRWASIDVLYYHYTHNRGSNLIVPEEEAIEMVQTRTDWSSDWALYDKVLDHNLDPANRTRQERKVWETEVASNPIHETSLL